MLTARRQIVTRGQDIFLSWSIRNFSAHQIRTITSREIQGPLVRRLRNHELKVKTNQGAVAKEDTTLDDETDIQNRETDEKVSVPQNEHLQPPDSQRLETYFTHDPPLNLSEPRSRSKYRLPHRPSFSSNSGSNNLDLKDHSAYSAKDTVYKRQNRLKSQSDIYPEWVVDQEDPESGFITEEAIHKEAEEAEEAEETGEIMRTNVKRRRIYRWEKISPRDLTYKKIEPPMEMPPVPVLAHGLDRVLFSPGVHYLQDPRSKVYNFDPWLQHVCPPSQFDYDALAPYITSSKDNRLGMMAKAFGKRYIGSTSSISATLMQFYFLVSNWREVDTSHLSSAFLDQPRNFNRASRAPASIYLRWKESEGVYAIDAEKLPEDEETILSTLGKSMEMMMTLSPEEFNKYQVGNSWQLKDDQKRQPESYAFGEIENFLLRSQLDCRDDRLPNKIFDLKTRAAIAVRLDSRNYMQYVGYQLKRSHGLLESFEREYYDLIRSAFLKYSFQVRIGHMDGVFVCFHNTSRVFGFQYISLEEMDARLFGNSVLGQQAFVLSLRLLGMVLDMATQKYPQKTLRITFETRRKVQRLPIFVEVVPEDESTPSSPTEFFSTSPEPSSLLYQPYLPYTQYDLVGYSKINKSQVNGPVSLASSGNDVWDFYYNLAESDDSAEQIAASYSGTRRRQAEFLSFPDEEYPLLRELKAMSKQGLQQLAEELEAAEENVIYRPLDEIKDSSDLAKAYRLIPSINDDGIGRKRKRIEGIDDGLLTRREIKRLDPASLAKHLREYNIEVSEGESEYTLRKLLLDQIKLVRITRVLNIWETQFRSKIVGSDGSKTGPMDEGELRKLTLKQLKFGCRILGISSPGISKDELVNEITRVIKTAKKNQSRYLPKNNSDRNENDENEKNRNGNDENSSGLAENH